MIRYYCTYFDSHYLSRAVALIESLRRHDPQQVVVYAVCHDELARVALDALQIPGVIAVPIHDLETWDGELLAAKEGRTRVEYYWTCTPTILLRLLERNPQIELLSYVDADLCFYSDPSPIWDELGNGDVLIHEHRFSAANAHLEAHAGRFNVGLVAFRNTDGAHAVLHDWRRRCLAWCYHRNEDGKIGDQGYLTDWPTRFPGVKILQHPGAGVAPWNHDRYELGVDANGAPTVDGRALIFYHYHAFVWLADGAFIPARHATYRIDPVIAFFFFTPYAQALIEALAQIRAVLPQFSRGLADEGPPADVALLTDAADRVQRPAHVRGPESAGWAVWLPRSDARVIAAPLTLATAPTLATAAASPAAPAVPAPPGRDAAVCGVAALTERRFTLTVATSIAPQGEEKQQRAVASWLALGFSVLSFNNPDEIRVLAPRYPQVRFIAVERDGRERTGKPLVYVDDVFGWFRASGLPHGGFINSDIVLKPANPAGFLDSMRVNIEGAMLFSRRIEVDHLDKLEGPYYPTGFDVWFFDTRVLSAFDQPTEYFVGFPHWDYYTILMPLVHGFPVRQFAYPFAYHAKHQMYYNVVRDGIPYGLKTFELVAPFFDRIAGKNHLLTPLLKFFLERRPAGMQRQEDIDYHYAFLHALDLWFLDVIDRNSEKIHFAAAVPALRDAGVPFLNPAAFDRAWRIGAVPPAAHGAEVATAVAVLARDADGAPWWTVDRPVRTEDDMLLEFARRQPELCAKTRTLIVVGAHLYQERELFRRLFPNLQLTVLFEPIPDVARALEQMVAGDASVKVLPYAIGDRDGIADFHVTDNLASSSLLPMKEHRTVFPWVHDLGTIQVQVRRLEGVLKEHGLPDPDLLMLDVQGAEHMVLSSLSESFRAAIPAIYTEASTAELYAGARTLDDLIALLGTSHAFKGFARLTNEVDNHGNAIFVRRDLVGGGKPPGLHGAGPAAFRMADSTRAPAAVGLALSVIVPTFNRASILRRCLDHLAAQSLAPDRFEVIVIDDGSTDETAGVLESCRTPFHLIHESQANLGPAAARNRGLRRARAHLVVFVNDDALLAPQALEIHLAEHARRGANAAVLGTFTMHPDYVRQDGPVGYCLDHSDLIFDYGRMAPGQPYGHQFFYTCNLSIRRDFVLRHGGFDEGFVRMGAEDIELGYRLQKEGCEIYFRPDCIALHAHRLTPLGIARMFEFRGRGGVHRVARAPDETPHYAKMPPGRIDEILSAHATLQPRLEVLYRAIEQIDGLRYVRTADVPAALDETTLGLSFRMLWTWPVSGIDKVLQALLARLAAHIDAVADDPRASLEDAAARVYPALQFVKWYHDTLGVANSKELRAYLKSRQAALPA